MDSVPEPRLASTTDTIVIVVLAYGLKVFDAQLTFADSQYHTSPDRKVATNNGEETMMKKPTTPMDETGFNRNHLAHDEYACTAACSGGVRLGP